MHTRILVIEDNPENSALMTYLLNQFGYYTLKAMDGIEGLALAKKEVPDLVICDIRLPSMNGYEIAKELKISEQFSYIPIIAVTAYSMVGDHYDLLAAGFDGYISKPIDPEYFISKIEKFLPIDKKKNREPTVDSVTNQKREKD